MDMQIPSLNTPFSSMNSGTLQGNKEPGLTGVTSAGHQVEKRDLEKGELSDISNEIPSRKTKLAERVKLPFKTAGTQFAKWGLTTAVAIGAAGAVVGGLLGGAVTGAVTAPIAGVIKLVELAAGSKKGIAGTVMLSAFTLGCLSGGVIGTSAVIQPAVIAGLGIGLAAGGVGFLRGIYDACKGDVGRMEREGKTLSQLLKNSRQVTDNITRTAREKLRCHKTSQDDVYRQEILEKVLPPGLPSPEPYQAPPPGPYPAQLTSS